MKRGDDGTDLVHERDDFSTQKLMEVHIGSSSFNKCNFTGTDLEESSFIKSTFTGCNFTGANLAKVYFNEVVFQDCKFDFTSFMSAKLKTVTFKNCLITDSMFAEAEVIKKLIFSTSTLERIDLRAVRTKEGMLDLRTSTLSELWGISAIRNVTIAPDQLTQIAPTLALEAGIKITDED